MTTTNKTQIEFTTEQLEVLFMALGMATGVCDQKEGEGMPHLRQCIWDLNQHCQEAFRRHYQREIKP